MPAIDTKFVYVRAPNARWIRRFRTVTTVIAAAVTLVGAGHLAAWLSGYMTERGMGAITMKTNAALGLAATGLSLLLLTRTGVGQRLWRFAQSLAALATLIGGITLAENITGWNLRIDQLLATEPGGALGTFGANRMGIPGSTCVLLAGLSLLFQSRTGDRNCRTGQSLALAVCLLALLASIGYLYGAQSFYAITRLTAIAWPMAVSLLALGLGLLLARPAQGLMAQVTVDDPGGEALRRWPPVLLVPVALGWVRVAGERNGLFDAATGTAFTMILVIVTLAVVAYRGSVAVSRSSAAILDREERLRLAHEAARVGTFDWDVRADRNSWTPELAAVYGLLPGAFPDSRQAWEDLVHPEDRALMAWKMDAALATGETVEGEWRVMWPDGTVHWIASRWRAVLDEAGAPARMVGVNMEVTDRKHMQEALEATVQDLERSNKELEQFAYVCAHDLQEPLRQVGWFVQLLQKRCADSLDGAAREYLAYISGGAHRMTELITGVLEYSRAGSAATPRQVTSCEQVLAAAISALSAAIAETGARITHDRLPAVKGSRTQLTQLFQNLIGNAIKFRREGVAPEIYIGCRQEASGWVFSVSDNGIGIPDQYHGRIFRMFQRLHTAEKYPGTGIGLAICQKIVEAHGGKIWIERQNRQGTAFCFTLPAEGETCAIPVGATGS